MKNKAFVKGVAILVVFSLIGKMIGALYRIPLARIIGGEGMGQYQLIFPLYCLILTISTSGMPVAISKIVAELGEQKRFSDAKAVLKISLVVLFFVSLICSGLVFLLAKQISHFQGNDEIYICYYAIAPAIVFVGLMSALRGFFQGNLNMFPSAISSLTEQIAKLVFGLYFANKLISFGVVYAVFGAVLGITISEFLALFVLVLFYIFRRRKRFVDGLKPLGKRELTAKMLRISLPVTLGGLISPATSMIDSFLVVNLLMFISFSSAQATALLGLQSGVVEPLVNLPIVIAVSTSVALLPSLSKLTASGDKESQNNLISRTFEMTLSISLTAGVCFVIYGRQVLDFLYGGSFSSAELLISTKLLFLSVINVLSLSLVQVSSSVLQALGQASQTVKSLAVGCALKIALNVCLVIIPQINILGVVISGGVSFLVVFAMNYRKIKKLTGVKIFSLGAGLAIQQVLIATIAFSTNTLFKLILSDVTALIFSGLITILMFISTYYVFFVYRGVMLSPELKKELEK